MSPRITDGSGRKGLGFEINHRTFFPGTMTRKTSKIDPPLGDLTRREMLTRLAATSLAAGSCAADDPTARRATTTHSAKAIKALHESLSAEQRKAICYGWDYRGPSGRPLRLHVTNNWSVSPLNVKSFSLDQQALIAEIIQSVLADDWPAKLQQQAKDDTGRHWTEDRKIAIFGEPSSGRCQCVISGFHLTLRAVETASDGVAFGGAICHGHQPSGFNEKPGHPGNVFWHQAQKAHEVYQILDGKQQTKARLKQGMPWYEFDQKIDRRVILPETKLDRPREPDVRFRGEGDRPPGLPIEEMTRDQQEAMRAVLASLLAPYQKEYQDQVLACLKKQGGLAKCRLAFYEEHQMSKEGQWDNWRLEGPSLVWFFRGTPHVHIWIHVAEDPATPVTSHFG